MLHVPKAFAPRLVPGQEAWGEIHPILELRVPRVPKGFQHHKVRLVRRAIRVQLVRRVFRV
ncbi:hypothetical protein [Lysinibacter sp. HNR]|uniref:hypothetical protein n=1 Tax=Lysinibacter sp. HNR TaxID=3031408 RepID=UPI00243539F6|nr:hypothetical protein [Lysinibacter sp. HNR]WGD38195.1 hypothetical protein FrondiHNR_04575 [Lysinibacter sp. HNR]